ncbi:benenodin family lasso peptide [Sphingorhabdus sp. IMCC26285]|uniref:Benenodin family lasso peptide n=1 Tax=Sphingorhabdus profundilacus TaxID=2509718 RepID=A0A6I4LYM0_9SPHN|nr:benenodin family lasso peptide [Sphingorhabdus profundilacus]MVZ98151.1 benenodin family lasso peptide [Sphingorhabdus profundilacus]
MKDVELREDTVIDLGQASVETKGDAIFESDGSGGKLVYATGIAND